MEEVVKKKDKNTEHVPADINILKGKEYENISPIPEDLGDRWLRWKCLKCGFVYEGREPLNVCPKCGNSDPDLFGEAF